MVWRLKKALYGLRRSPLLWQKHLKSLLSGVGLTPLGDEPDILISNKLIVAIYVDDILLMYHERHASAAAVVLALLRANFKLREWGEPEQFLSLQIYRHRRSKTLWINQSMYIEKIANRFLNTDGLDQKKRIALPDASIFHPHDDQASIDAIRRYQQKTGSLLYAAVQSRPDVAFIVSRLCRHNANQSGTRLDRRIKKGASFLLITSYCIDARLIRFWTSFHAAGELLPPMTCRGLLDRRASLNVVGTFESNAYLWRWQNLCGNRELSAWTLCGVRYPQSMRSGGEQSVLGKREL